AQSVKGFGFPGAGTNAAHNLPLSGIPALDEAARREFNEGAAALFVPPEEIADAVESLAVHESQQRSRESRHPMAVRHPQSPALPEHQRDRAGDPPDCAMHALDRWFVRLVDANPALRVRVGNPDELR